MKITIKNTEIETDDFVKKWTEKALAATPADDALITSNIQKLYEKAGLKRPNVVIFREYDDFVLNDWQLVEQSALQLVGHSVWQSVGQPVRQSVAQSVEQSVAQSVGHSVEQSVAQSVEHSVAQSMAQSVAQLVGQSVRQSVWQLVRQSVMQSEWQSVGLWYWADDFAYADVFSAAEILSPEKTAELEEYSALLETQRLGILTDETAYILVAPVVRTNKMGQLHSDSLPAVQWGKSGLYFLNDVSFSKELFLKITSPNVTAQDILSIEDVDQRTQAMRFLPPEEMTKELKGEILDEFNKFTVEGEPVNYKLYRFPKGKVFTEDAYYCLFDCPSTRKKHMEGVEVSTTVPQAMAWAEGISEEEWKRRIPLTHEV